MVRLFLATEITNLVKCVLEEANIKHKDTEELKVKGQKKTL